MVCWPVPESDSRELPKAGTPGGFWHDRGDRRHCGVDIYAPEGSRVFAISGGTVLGSGIFTSPGVNPYWRTTFYVLIKSDDSKILRYAELQNIFVRKGDRVAEGQVIGRVGTVIDKGLLTDDAPDYIRALSDDDRRSMLHLEYYTKAPEITERYFGGNLFSEKRPRRLVDPAILFGKSF